MAYAKAEKTAIKMCQLCLDGKEQKAEMYCMDCKKNSCFNCFSQHKKIPLLAKHRFVSCDVDIDSDEEIKSKDEEKLLKVLKQTIKKDINNEKSDKKNPPKNPPSREDSKIVASVNTLERMVENAKISDQPWKVRYIQGSISALLKNMQHVKTIYHLPDKPNRLGIVNSDIWVRCYTEPIINFSKYNSDLVKTGEVKYKHEAYTETAQQVDSNHVVVTSSSGLHVFNCHGEHLYKVSGAWFSDVNVGTDTVSAVDFINNKVIKLHHKNNQWLQCDQFTINDRDKKLKTIHAHKNCTYVCIQWSDKMYKYNNKGELLEQFGTGQRGSQLGQFYGPSVCGSDQNGCILLCDSNNHRFLFLDTIQGKWEQMKITGIECPKDVLIIGNNIFILHGYDDNIKLSKYCIMNTN